MKSAIPAFGKHFMWQRSLRTRLREHLVYWVRRWRNRGKTPAPQASTEVPAVHERVLLIDDRVPDETLGSGFPRSCALIEALIELGWRVTIYQTSFAREPREQVSRWLDRGVEVVLNQGMPGLRRFLRRRRDCYKAVIVSRPHNMARAKSQLFRLRRRRAVSIIYDAEAVFSSREILRQRIGGAEISDSDAERIKADELQLVVGVDVILTVSELEADQFRRYRADTHGPVFVLPHVTEVTINPRRFTEREGFVFVGALQDEHSPNTDAIRWFLAEVLPNIQQRTNNGARLTIVGTHHPAINLEAEGVRHIGSVPKVKPFLEHARVFVAPSRFAAGVPLKVYEAASAGIPVVASSLLGRQLGWSPNDDLLVADSPEAFATACLKLYQDEELWTRVQVNALARVERDCSAEQFKRTLAAAFQSKLFK